MKNIVKAVLFSCVLISFFAGCASTQSAPVENLPWWCTAGASEGTGMQFDSEVADRNPRGATWPVNKLGFYAEGKAKRADGRQSGIAARVDARANLAAYISQNSARSADSSGNQLDSEKLDVLLSGSMVIDSYIESNGTVHVLIFISNSDLEKNKERALKVE